MSAGTLFVPGLSRVPALLAPTNPTVAITGTFFGPRNGYPVGDIVMDGQLKASGQRGSGVGVDGSGRVSIFDTRFHQPFDWSAYRYGLRGAVRLVANGKVCPNPKAQRFHDKHIWGRASRIALGVRADGKVLVLATQSQVTLSELGKAMVSRGVKNAINLDGGSSTCLVYRGKMLIRPARKLSNMFTLSEASYVRLVK